MPSRDGSPERTFQASAGARLYHPDVASQPSPEWLKELVGGIGGHLASGILEESCNTTSLNMISKVAGELKMHFNSHTSKLCSQTG